MGMTKGFNPNEVSSSIGAVISAHTDLMSCLADKMQTKFVDQMGQVWACKQAQDFFAGFKTAVDDLIQKSDSTFQSVVDTMNQGADNWAKETETAYTKIPFHNCPKRITVEGVIKENINNERGIDDGAANTTVGSLAHIAVLADASLTKAANAVKKCGFIGGQQAANIVKSLNDIKTKIKESFDQITGNVKTGIQETIDTYGRIETSNAETFVAK